MEHGKPHTFTIVDDFILRKQIKESNTLLRLSCLVQRDSEARSPTRFYEYPKFLPIKIEFLVNKKRNYLFTEVVFDKKHEQPLLTSRFLKNRRAQYFTKSYPRNGAITYRSKARKKLNNWDRVYANVLKEYEGFNIASILTRAGYSYYCDLAPGKYHHLAYALLSMFYLGTAARYRPTEVEEVMSGEFRPLANETAAICPKQLLYQIVSRVTERLCVIPFADF